MHRRNSTSEARRGSHRPKLLDHTQHRFRVAPHRHIEPKPHGKPLRARQAIVRARGATCPKLPRRTDRGLRARAEAATAAAAAAAAARVPSARARVQPGQLVHLGPNYALDRAGAKLQRPNSR